VLRGRGADSTKLLFDLGGKTDPCIQIITYKRGEWVNAVSGHEKDSGRLVVADPAKFSAGQYVEIQQDNDSALMYTQSEWKQSWGEYAVGQILRVEAISGDTLVLDKGLYMTYRKELNPMVRSQGFVEYAGVERLFIIKADTASDGNTILLKNAAFCLIREIESEHTRKAHVSTNTAYRCEIRDSYFHHSYDYGGSGHGYGAEFGFHTTDCLVENNVFRHLRHSMMVHVGASGNVFGYNYSVENVQGDGEINLNQGWTPCDISMHGHYANYNLFESNIVREIDFADYWGPVGPGNTVFRCRTMAEGIEVMDHSHNQNVVGNLLGTGLNVLIVDSTCRDVLVHGTVIGGVTVWDSSISDRTLPQSYYLKEKPAFFDGTPWPVIGPDVAGDAKLPAESRYDEGMPVSQPRLFGKPRSNFPQSVSACWDNAVCGAYDIRGRLLLSVENAFGPRNFHNSPQLFANVDGLSAGIRVLHIESGNNRVNGRYAILY
jgi:hypothetical protein